MEVYKNYDVVNIEYYAQTADGHPIIEAGMYFGMSNINGVIPITCIPKEYHFPKKIK